MLEDLIPVVLFISVAVVVALSFYFKYRTRHDVQETVRAAITTGDPLSPEIIETLSLSLTNPYADLRRGIISLAIGCAIFLLAFFVGEEEAEAVMPLMGVAMFPVLLGLAYLGLWFFVGRGRQDGRT